MPGNQPTLLSPLFSLSVCATSLLPFSILFITRNLCRGINDNSHLYLLVDGVKQRKEMEVREGGDEEGTVAECLLGQEKIATMTDGGARERLKYREKVGERKVA